MDHHNLQKAGYSIVWLVNIVNQKADLDRGEDNASVDMLKLWDHPFANMLALLLVVRNVSCQRVEYGHSAPL